MTTTPSTVAGRAFAAEWADAYPEFAERVAAIEMEATLAHEYATTIRRAGPDACDFDPYYCRTHNSIRSSVRDLACAIASALPDDVPAALRLDARAAEIAYFLHDVCRQEWRAWSQMHPDQAAPSDQSMHDSSAHLRRAYELLGDPA